MEEAKSILEDHKLRNTSCRSEVLELFLSQKPALSHADIESKADPAFDRVTVYRTLKTFVEKGILHKVLDDAGVTKYALCHDCSVHEHRHEHVHFKCKNCEKTTCLDNIEIPGVQLPDGYKIFEKNLLIQGLCPDCTHTA